MQCLLASYTQMSNNGALCDLRHSLLVWQAYLGSKISIQHNGGVDRCSILHPSAVSHTNNMGQRLVLLKTLSNAKGVVTVLLPEHPLVAPPGHWMLFCSNKGEEFSEATWLEILP
jgi:hypothetical protein